MTRKKRASHASPHPLQACDRNGIDLPVRVTVHRNENGHLNG